VKSEQAEVAAAEDKLRAEETVLRQVQANRAQIAIVEAIVAADQQALLETKKELVKAASSRFCSARRIWSKLNSTSATPSFAARLPESLVKGVSKRDKT
jgi:hypothetical protein